MPTITVLYPRSEGASFDFDYYTGTHLPLIRDSYEGEGLTRVEALKGVPDPQGNPSPFVVITLIGFDSDASLAKAFGSDKIQAIAGDVVNFTNITPVAQTNVPI